MLKCLLASHSTTLGVGQTDGKEEVWTLAVSCSKHQFNVLTIGLRTF